jgi:hypothetical protein
VLEGRQGDVDDGDVEDRHDRAEDDDAGDLEDGAVDLVGIGVDGCVNRGRARQRVVSVCGKGARLGQLLVPVATLSPAAGRGKTGGGVMRRNSSRLAV